MADTSKKTSAAAATAAQQPTIAELLAKIEALEARVGPAVGRPAAGSPADGTPAAVGTSAALPQAVRDNERRMRERVRIKLFKDNDRYKDDVFVGINDETFLIQRGVEVEVPRYVEEVLKSSLAQDERAALLMEEKSAEYEKSL